MHRVKHGNKFVTYNQALLRADGWGYALLKVNDQWDWYQVRHLASPGMATIPGGYWEATNPVSAHVVINDVRTPEGTMP